MMLVMLRDTVEADTQRSGFLLTGGKLDKCGQA